MSSPVLPLCPFGQGCPAFQSDLCIRAGLCPKKLGTEPRTRAHVSHEDSLCSRSCPSRLVLAAGARKVSPCPANSLEKAANPGQTHGDTSQSSLRR